MRASLSQVLGAAVAVAAALPGQVGWHLDTPMLPFAGQNIAVHDPVAGRTIVVALMSNETWALRGITGVWQLLQGATGSPGWRYETTLAHDSQRNRTVLFGGTSPTGTAMADTWEFDGTAWQFLTPTNAPSARHDAGSCYDRVAGVVRLAGGDAAPVGGTAQPLSDCWTFDGVRWSPVAGGGGPIGPTAMVYDDRRDRCVAVAGNGTFEWVGPGFTAITTAALPPARTSTAMVYDYLRQRVVLYGGNSAPYVVLGDVWEYDGSAWIERAPLGTYVISRGRHGMVFDPAVGAVRVFGGIHAYQRGVATTTLVLGEGLRYEPVSPAITWKFATGCPGSPWPLDTSGLPWVGATMSLEVALSMIGASVVFALGWSDRQALGQPLPMSLAPVGLPGCDLVVSPDWLQWVTAGGFNAMLPLSIPADPVLLGAQLFAQAFLVQAPAPNLLQASHGVMLRIGGR